ncbi:MAG: hypothetical protein HKN09_08000 [Saprospiraceae bacterium]|nr:hypothetical protein [Saprospiraceae bacterium]
MKWITAIVLFLLSNSIYAQDISTLEKDLFNLPDVIFKKIETPKGYLSAYELKIKQPIDHNNPEGGHFYQKVYLSHKGYDRPTAIITNGYARGSNNITEVAELLETNQLNVEHRYFASSSPEDKDYQYLNFEQITQDLHKIRTLFDGIYTGKWISTGISKGGTTTIFYKYFFPDDVDVAIPYVAPVNHSDEDPRIYSFLDTIGTEACRKNIHNYQVRLLRGADKIKPFLRWYTKGQGLKFGYLSFDEAFEYAVLEYPFSFWQYGRDCEKIPDAQDDIEKHAQHLIDIVGLEFYSDASMSAFASHYYQSATEMGYYGFETKDFDKLLKHIPIEPHPSAAFTPNKMEVKFDGDLTNRVAEWAHNEADKIIYINGAVDTWSATAVPAAERDNALWFFMEGKHHANARIKNMNNKEKALLGETLSAWLEEEVSVMDAKDPEAEIKKLKGMMTGTFSSAEQAKMDSSYFDITLQMYPIWEDRPGHWLYVEQAVSKYQYQPYRQRIYHLHETENGFVSDVYEIKEAERFVGKWRAPEYFDGYSNSILKKREGCGVQLKKKLNGYEGSTGKTSCKSSLRGASYATSKVSISEDVLESWDQGFDADGNQVWGAIKGPYVFKKQ